MDTSPRILQLNVGLPRDLVGKDGRPFRSSVGRQPVEGPRQLSANGFEGDACEYDGHHGANMKVNVFCAETYKRLEALLETDLTKPSFGENLLIEGWPEDVAAVGDTFRAGTAVLQISQPREPCGTLVRFTGISRILKTMTRNNATGYYMRVVQPGEVSGGDSLALMERVAPEWTIKRLNRLMYENLADKSAVREAERVETLSSNWKRSLRLQHERARRRAEGKVNG